jgi:hypothetical protein
MFYFKQIIIDKSFIETSEEAIRNYSSKRHTSLDLTPSSSYIKEDKFFLGLEGENDLKITRIRTAFEKYFPKVIISFPKDRHFETYKIRYSLLSSIVFFILLFAALQTVFYVIFGEEDAYELLALVIVFLSFIVLTFLEINVTKRKINQAIMKFDKRMIVVDKKTN